MSKKSKSTAGVTVRRIKFESRGGLLNHLNSQGVRSNKKKKKK
jgi:hypothetical protein